VTGSHRFGSIKQAAGEGYSENIIIGDGVWIGFGVTILCGVTIGEGVVIAAGSVVTNDIPSGVLIAGVPAVVKKVLFK
jgi:maltose O-acetyltransferase